MSVEVEGKVYRNLPEQVEENANNIQWLLETIRNFGNVMRYCGSVATYDDLPTENNKVGDVYNVLDTGNNYAWDGEGWDEISSIVDLSGYVTKINCPLPEYQFNTENIISTIEQYGLANKAIIVNTPSHKMIVYITERLNVYSVSGYELRMSAYIGFQVQPTSIWAVIPSQFMVFEYQMKEYSKRYLGTYVGNESEFSTEMNVGDIIVESTGGQFLINEIEFDANNELTKVILVGLEDNGNPVVHKFENGGWSTSNYINANFVDLTSAQTISALKTFLDGIGIGTDAQCKIERILNNLVITSYGNLILAVQPSGTVDPSRNNIDIGRGLSFRDVYVSRYLTDRINHVAIAEIGKKLLSIESQRHLTTGEAKQCVGGIQVQSDYFLNLGGGVLLKNPYITGMQVTATNIDITAIGLNPSSQMIFHKARLSINSSDDNAAVTESNIVTSSLEDMSNLIAYAKAQGWIS